MEITIEVGERLSTILTVAGLLVCLIVLLALLVVATDRRGRK